MKKLLTIVLLLLTVALSAQKPLKVEGHARIIQTEDMTPAEARLRVVEQARFEAIKEKFGANISQNNVTMTTDVNGQTDVTFYMLGESDLRGTWVRDTAEPEVTQQIVEGQTVWEAFVKGEAREQTRATVNFEWNLLAGGLDDHFFVTELHDGQAFFIKFRSPVNGYLLIFMADDKGSVNCLAPGHDEEYCTVEKNQWKYLYYDPQHPDNYWVATLRKSRKVEYDQLYVLFSPNKVHPPMTKRNADNSDLKHYSAQDNYHYEHIPELSFGDFQKYLGKLIRSDPEVQIEKMLVKISN